MSGGGGSAKKKVAKKETAKSKDATAANRKVKFIFTKSCLSIAKYEDHFIS